MERSRETITLSRRRGRWAISPRIPRKYLIRTRDKRDDWERVRADSLLTRIPRQCHQHRLSGFKQPRRRQEFTSLLNFLAVILLSILTPSIGPFSWRDHLTAITRIQGSCLISLINFFLIITITIFSQNLPS